VILVCSHHKVVDWFPFFGIDDDDEPFLSVSWGEAGIFFLPFCVIYFLISFY